MTGRDPRLSVEALRQFAELRDYKVSEVGPYDFAPDEMHLDLDGHGELFEAHFRQNPRTRYWRFDYGFRHVGVTGDTYRTLKAFKDIVRPQEGQDW